MKNKFDKKSILLALLAVSNSSDAYTLYTSDETTLDLDLTASYGGFHSGENYSVSGAKTRGSSSWSEGSIKYGFSGTRVLTEQSVIYGAFSLATTVTWGNDGDAAGWTNGSERTSKIEDAKIGWRSGNLFPLMGEDGVDISAGRQMVVVGDGFLIAGDALNFGRGFMNDQFNRGGAYYLSTRRNFDETFIVRLGNKEGWRGDLMRLKSDNPAQAKPELNVFNLEHVTTPLTLGLTYIDITDIDRQFASPAQLDRKDMKIWSVRGQGNLGVENLFLSAEYASQDKENSATEKAWYTEGGWKFFGLPLQPYLSYRFSYFSEGYDPLFYGFTRGYGTWFQGEVAANYSGPFSSNTRTHNVGAKITPLPNLELGAQGFAFKTLDKSQGNLDAREIDLYAIWQATPSFSVMPLVGWYKPKKSAENGGTQLGGNDTNLYGQFILAYTF